MAGRRRTDPQLGRTALAAWLACADQGKAPGRQETTTAVRYSLEELAHLAPGGSVEVRVPPAGVVQVIAGPKHTRGTPANVIEMDATTWLSLVTGRLTWDQALASGSVLASGERANLSQYLPLPLPLPGCAKGV